MKFIMIGLLTILTTANASAGTKFGACSLNINGTELKSQCFEKSFFPASFYFAQLGVRGSYEGLIREKIQEHCQTTWKDTLGQSVKKADLKSFLITASVYESKNECLRHN
ncbi:MAG: hypothetical protein K2P81_11580 [Bacteriovoracaceae bacterium]|nr:hypothetical protein [Bacteriovoracaceae bacterium]